MNVAINQTWRRRFVETYIGRPVQSTLKQGNSDKQLDDWEKEARKFHGKLIASQRQSRNHLENVRMPANNSKLKIHFNSRRDRKLFFDMKNCEYLPICPILDLSPPSPYWHTSSSSIYCCKYCKHPSIYLLLLQVHCTKYCSNVASVSAATTMATFHCTLTASACSLTTPQSR